MQLTVGFTLSFRYTLLNDFKIAFKTNDFFFSKIHRKFLIFCSSQTTSFTVNFNVMNVKAILKKVSRSLTKSKFYFHLKAKRGKNNNNKTTKLRQPQSPMRCVVVRRKLQSYSCVRKFELRTQCLDDEANNIDQSLFSLTLCLELLCVEQGVGARCWTAQVEILNAMRRKGYVLLFSIFTD